MSSQLAITAATAAGRIQIADVKPDGGAATSGDVKPCDILAESPSTPRSAGSAADPPRTPSTQPRVSAPPSHLTSKDFEPPSPKSQSAGGVCGGGAAMSTKRDFKAKDLRDSSASSKWVQEHLQATQCVSEEHHVPVREDEDSKRVNLEAFLDNTYDVVCAKLPHHPFPSDSQGWKSKSVTQKIRYLAELKTWMLGNDPLPVKSGFVRAHKYPVFLAAEAMSTMTDEQRMIMLNFQNSSSNYMMKRSQEKHNEWEQEFRNCVGEGKAMSSAAIQHVKCQVHSLIVHYQTQIACPSANKVQLDGWFKAALMPFTINPTGTQQNFKPGHGLEKQIDAALESFPYHLQLSVKSLFAEAKRVALETLERNATAAKVVAEAKIAHDAKVKAEAEATKAKALATTAAEAKAKADAKAKAASDAAAAKAVADAKIALDAKVKAEAEATKAKDKALAEAKAVRERQERAAMERQQKWEREAREQEARVASARYIPTYTPVSHTSYSNCTRSSPAIFSLFSANHGGGSSSGGDYWGDSSDGYGGGSSSSSDHRCLDGSRDMRFSDNWGFDKHS
jgi:hypothetical protein